MASLLQRTSTATATGTLDTAANIINAIDPTNGVEDGTSWRLRIVENAAYVNTIVGTAHTGITVVNPTVNASSVKDFLVQVTCGAIAQTVGTAIVTNSSAVITGMTAAQTALLRNGMVVTNSQNGLQDATIISIQPGVGVTMSTTATSGATTPVTLNFSPTISITGIGQMLL